MRSVILPLALLFALQLDPALTPQKRAKPVVPKVDENACPFEGCQFGHWTAREPVQLYSSWKSDRTPIYLLTKGESLEALTGVNVTLEPSEIKVVAAMPEYGLKPGDVIFEYMYVGEGVFNAWFNGFWVEQFDGSGVSGLGCSRNCTAKLIKHGQSEWWVQLKTKNGIIGWTSETEKFDGKDALAQSRPVGEKHS